MAPVTSTVGLPDDSETCARALELILLERRCCPFLSLALAFERGSSALTSVLDHRAGAICG